MIVTFEDDACLHAYASLDAVVLQVEALDAEDSLRLVFGQDGQKYQIEWLKPNVDAQNGTYRLVTDGPRDPRALLELIRRVGNDPARVPPEVQVLEHVLARIV